MTDMTPADPPSPDAEHDCFWRARAAAYAQERDAEKQRGDDWKQLHDELRGHLITERSVRSELEAANAALLAQRESDTWTDEAMREWDAWEKRWRREHEKVARLTAALRDAVSTWTDTMTYAEHNRRKVNAEATLAGETTDTPRAQE